MTRIQGAVEIRNNVPLAPYTTLGVGGAAQLFAAPATEEQVFTVLKEADSLGCPVFVLGGGSNLLVSDDGFPGLVIKLELKGIRRADEAGQISAAAGESWDDVVDQSVEGDLAGLECLSGIPGTVGGAPIQNIGAYGVEACETIRRIRVLDRQSGSIAELAPSDCAFAYRTSVFNTTRRDRYIVLRVDFGLRPGGKPHLAYGDLARHFGSRVDPTIATVREAVLGIRRSKGMVVCDDDPDSKSAGSFFKNPVLTSEAVALIEERVRNGGERNAAERIPRFSMPDGKEKVPAAWLIERAGFGKGFRMGRAGISAKHSLAIVNCGGATAQEIVDLMRRIQDQVRTAFAVDLQPEPVFVGFRNPQF